MDYYYLMTFADALIVVMIASVSVVPFNILLRQLSL